MVPLAGALVLALLVVLAAPAAAAPREPLVIAHRGASHAAPENTLTAIDQALALGADVVEVDVQMTRDRALVLLHDLSLARTTDVETRFPDRAPWHVGDFTLDEVRTLDAGSWKSPAFAGERIPTLDDALAAVRGRAGLLLEIKAPHRHPGIEAAVASALTTDGTPVGPADARDDVVVQSFDRHSVAAFARLQPGVDTAQLVGGPVSAGELQLIAAYADAVNPYHAGVDPGFVAAAHAAGLRVNPYTVDRPRRIDELLDAGVDGIITDVPDVALRTRERAG